MIESVAILIETIKLHSSRSSWNAQIEHLFDRIAQGGVASGEM
jgi:hypothetical protein